MAVASQTAAENLTAGLICSIRTTMHRQGISAASLAEKAGVSRPYLHRVFAGEQQPSIDWLARVCAALGLRLAVKIYWERK